MGNHAERSRVEVIIAKLWRYGKHRKRRDVESGSETPRLFDGRRKEWFSIDNIIVDEYLDEIEANGLALYCVLSRLAENGSGISFPRQSWLEEKLSWSNSKVRRTLRTLINAGLLKRVPRFRETDGGQMANDYILVDVQDRSSMTRGVFTDEQGDAHGGPANTKTQSRTHRQQDNSSNSNELGENTSQTPKKTESESLPSTYVAYIARKLEDSTVPLDAAYKMRFGKDIKAALKKDIDKEVLDMAVERIIERWDDYQLSLRQAMTDITNKKTTPGKKKSATPEEAVERLMQRSDLARYAGVAETFDFTSQAEPPWYVMKELGGDRDEQRRNLEKVRRVVGWSRPVRERQEVEHLMFNSKGELIGSLNGSH